MARGPAYPFVSLEEAVEFANKVYRYTRRSPAQADAVVREAWKYSPTSSSSKKTLAAVKYFGLIEDVTNSDTRSVRITDRAYRILVDEHDSPERRQALRDAVLSPRAYAYCWSRWGKEMPPSMRSTLLFEEGFVETTVDSFLADYKRSIEYAGLLEETEQEQEQIQTAPAPEVASEAESSLTAITAVPSVRAKPAFASVQVNDVPEMRSDVFSLNEGPVTLTWPRKLGRESFQDLVDWLDLLKRKIERAIPISE